MGQRSKCFQDQQRRICDEEESPRHPPEPSKHTHHNSTSSDKAHDLSISCALMPAQLDGGCDQSTTTNPPASLWKRIKWGLTLSFGGRRAFSVVRKSELKAAVAAVLEISIMGSALVLTVGMQVQEVVGGRSGLQAQNGSSFARHLFITTSAFSFALAMYSILTCSVMHLTLSLCPTRYVLCYPVLFDARSLSAA